jgi:hypothetical protein
MEAMAFATDRGQYKNVRTRRTQMAIAAEDGQRRFRQLGMPPLFHQGEGCTLRPHLPLEIGHCSLQEISSLFLT